MADPILYKARDQAAWITLNRPEVHNALNTALTVALDDALQRALSDEAVRVIVLTGAGRTFCAGLDLTGATGNYMDAGAEGGRSHYISIVKRMMESPKPVLGRVQGSAFGAGIGLVLACDLVIAVDTAQFGVTEPRFGLPATVIQVIMNHRLLLGAGREILLSGTKFSAEKALGLHLVQHVVPEQAMDASVAEILQDFLRCAPGALAKSKAIRSAIRDLPLEEGLDYAGGQRDQAHRSPEAQEGKAAFREKRQPRWAP